MKNFTFIVLSFALAVACGLRPSGNSSNVNGATPAPTAAPTATPSSSAQSATATIMFIVDSSGSMKENAGEKTKMDSAKQVIAELVENLSTSTKVGLMAYGHRRKNDCNDVEVLIPPGPVDKQTFEQTVQGLQPLGETPISFAIQQAADALKGVDGKKTIVLISDGEETCHMDPCAVAAALKKANADLQIDVVGFGVNSDKARNQLHCIAESTGGVYKDAANAGELQKVLEGIASAATTASDQGRLVTKGLNAVGQTLHYHVTLYRPGSDESLSQTESGLVQDYYTDSAPLEINPGVYDVKYSGSELPVIWRRNVEVKSGEDTVVDLGQWGRIHIDAKRANGEPAGLNTYIFLPGETDTMKSFSGTYPNTEPDLPPGTYDIRFWNGEVDDVWRKGIVVTAGQITNLEVRLDK